MLFESRYLVLQRLDLFLLIGDLLRLLRDLLCLPRNNREQLFDANVFGVPFDLSIQILLLLTSTFF